MKKKESICPVCDAPKSLCVVEHNYTLKAFTYAFTASLLATMLVEIIF